MSKAVCALVAASILAFVSPGRAADVPPPPPQGDEVIAQQAFVEAMKPWRAGRPLIAIVALNDGTEMTDLLLDVPDEGPTAFCDRERVAQIMRILLDNALRHTPEGTDVTVSASRYNGAAELTVADTGPGLPAGARVKVFERFFTGDAARGVQAGGVRGDRQAGAVHVVAGAGVAWRSGVAARGPGGAVHGQPVGADEFAPALPGDDEPDRQRAFGGAGADAPGQELAGRRDGPALDGGILRSSLEGLPSDYGLQGSLDAQGRPGRARPRTEDPPRAQPS